jgi:peptidoglycan/xylan/chitin deacetylase (PgdA/CDA1 family)
VEPSAGITRDPEAAANAAGSGRPSRVGMQRAVWNTDPAGPFASITFDDGPTPEYTPRILEILAAAGVRATFFVMGYNAVQHPDVLREVVAAGHELGNHSWSHLNHATLDADTIRTEIVRCRDEVEQLVQQPLVGFRPPRGELTGWGLRVCAELGHDVVLWSCTRGPSGTSTVDAVASWIGSTVQPGDIIDLHDGLGRGTFSPSAPFTRDLAARREVEVQALPEALARIADRGITLMPATELLARSAPEPLAGVRTAMTSGS